MIYIIEVWQECSWQSLDILHSFMLPKETIILLNIGEL